MEEYLEVLGGKFDRKDVSFSICYCTNCSPDAPESGPEMSSVCYLEAAHIRLTKDRDSRQSARRVMRAVDPKGQLTRI